MNSGIAIAAFVTPAAMQFVFPRSNMDRPGPQMLAVVLGVRRLTLWLFFVLWALCLLGKS